MPTRSARDHRAHSSHGVLRVTKFNRVVLEALRRIDLHVVTRIDSVLLPQSQAMLVASLEVAAHLRTILVVFTLSSLLVVPNAWLAYIDVRKRFDVVDNLLFQFLWHASPKRVVGSTIKPRVADIQTADPAIVARENR